MHARMHEQLLQQLAVWHVLSNICAAPMQPHKECNEFSSTVLKVLGTGSVSTQFFPRTAW